MKISKSQVLNALTVAVAAGLSITQAAGANGIHIPPWVLPLLTAIASASRSIIPALSGVPGQQPGVVSKPPV